MPEVLREQAGSVLLVSRAASSLFRAAMTFFLTVIEGGGLPPWERQSLLRKVSS